MENNIDYRKVFDLFVSHDDLRPELMKPFKQYGRYYATDALRLIFIPCDVVELNYPEQDCPKVHKAIPVEKTMDITINISEIESQISNSKMIDESVPFGNDVVCEECKGNGEVIVEYKGKKTTYEMEVECPVCKGDGYSERIYFKKTGKQIPNPNALYKLLGNGFQGKLLKTLVSACRLMNVEKITKTFGGEGNANVFKAGEATIIIMPAFLDPLDDEVTEIKLNDCSENTK